VAEDGPSPARVAALFLAYEKGDIRSPSRPGGQGGKSQRTQLPKLRVQRRKRHVKNKAKDNRAALKRYHMKYKRKPLMKKRQPLYRKNPNKYTRKGPKKYERPDKTAVAQRFLDAGDLMLYDQWNPANNEIKQPGKDVDYRAVGPTTWTMSPGEHQGDEPGGGISDQSENVPPASSRVIPDQMKETLQDNLTYVRAAQSRTAAAKIDKIMGNCGPKIVQRSNGLQFRRTRILPKHGMMIYQVRGSVGGQSDGKTYTVRIKANRKGNVKALAKMPVKVSCSCPYFRWQGPEHWAKTNGYLYGRPVGTASKPVIKDPKDQHWVCKHVYAILKAKKGLRFASHGPSGTPEFSPLPDPVRVAAWYTAKVIEGGHSASPGVDNAQ
jgi:hypothetical protein